MQDSINVTIHVVKYRTTTFDHIQDVHAKMQCDFGIFDKVNRN